MFGKNKKEQNDVDKYLSKSIAKSRVHRKCSLFTIPIKVLS